MKGTEKQLSNIKEKEVYIMVFTDVKAIKMLRKINFEELEEMIETYTKDENEELEDLQILVDEAGYLLSMFDEDTVYYDDLKEARRIMSETKNGKCNKILMPGFRLKYSEWDIRRSRNTINQYNRLKRLVMKLQRMGYISRWIYL